MKPTRIDKFGRVVVPKPLRERLGLEAGAEVIIDGDDERIRLKPAGAAVAITTKEGVLVYRGTAENDLETALEEQRGRRAKALSTSLGKVKQ